MTLHSRDISQLIAQPWFVCGLEKEGLRVDTTGNLSNTAHPRSLGSKLTHPFITTDFAEAQLELITPPCSSTQEMLAHVARTHAFVVSQLNNEYIWPGSMPCILPRDDTIAIADFGSSYIGLAKTIYRRGLSHRYGRSMQAVSGIHFNFSFTEYFWQQLAHTRACQYNQDFVDAQYFSLTRNYRRYAWIIHMLFGASPCFDQSFLHNSQQAKRYNYQPCGENTWMAAGATSLRMTDIGYMAATQEVIRLCFDRLQDYISSIRQALTIPIAEFSAIGVRDSHGEYLQLNDYLLQIENEYYSQIRPKRTTQDYVRPVVALEQEGIEYIEIRNLDIDPQSPCGIDQESTDFIVLFLLWCLIEPSPIISDNECDHIQQNLSTISRYGRAANTQVTIDGKVQSVQSGLAQVFDSLEQLAKKLGHQYVQALSHLRNKVHVNCLPSQLTEQHCQNHQQGLISWYLSLAKQHQQHFTNLAPQIPQLLEQYAHLATQSHQQQSAIEHRDSNSPQSFEQFLEDYLRL